MSALRWIRMRPRDSTSIYNIFSDSDWLSVSQALSVNDGLISSARKFLDEVCGSVLVAIVLTKAHTKLLSMGTQGYFEAHLNLPLFHISIWRESCFSGIVKISWLLICWKGSSSRISSLDIQRPILRLKRVPEIWSGIRWGTHFV